MLLGFIFFTHGIILHYADGTQGRIWFNKYSGKPFARKKVGGIWVKHPCIVLGKDDNGRYWVVHNHYKQGHAFIDSLENFAQNQDVYPYPIECSSDISLVIETALHEVIAQRPYKLLHNNCQVTVNKACNGTAKSDDWETLKKVFAGIGIFAAGIFAFDALFKK